MSIAGPQAVLAPDFKLSTFKTAVAVSPSSIDKTRYAVDLKADWCIGIGTINNPHAHPSI